MSGTPIQAAVNDATPRSEARRPRGAIVIAGITIDRFIHAEVENNTFYQADKFRVQLAASALPPQLSLGFFASTADIPVEIWAGFLDDKNQIARDLLVSGNIDEISFDPVTSRYNINGRDLTSLFIEARTSDKYPDLTASQIAAVIAAKHVDANGNPIFQTAIVDTKGEVGRFYEREHARLTHEMTEWDLLTALAQEEQYVVFVRGNTLHFQPSLDSLPAPTAAPYVLAYSPATSSSPARGNFSRCELSRNLLVAKDIVVEVRSWSQLDGSDITRTFSAKNAKRGSSKKPQHYVFDVANYTLEEVLAYGNAKIKELSQHERLLRFAGPAVSQRVLDVLTPIIVRGTNSDFDQTYFPDTIMRTLSFDEGYKMDVRAKNHSTLTQVVIA